MLTHHAILVYLLHLHQRTDNTNESSVTVTDLPISAQIPQGVPSFSAEGSHHSSELQGHVFTCVTSTNSVHLKPHQNLSSSFSQISLTDLRSQALDHLFSGLKWTLFRFLRTWELSDSQGSCPEPLFLPSIHHALDIWSISLLENCQCLPPPWPYISIVLHGPPPSGTTSCPSFPPMSFTNSW